LSEIGINWANGIWIPRGAASPVAITCLALSRLCPVIGAQNADPWFCTVNPGKLAMLQWVRQALGTDFVAGK